MLGKKEKKNRFKEEIIDTRRMIGVVAKAAIKHGSPSTDSMGFSSMAHAHAQLVSTMLRLEEGGK